MTCTDNRFLRFSSLEFPRLGHLFTLRDPHVTSAASAVGLLGAHEAPFVQAEQIHGNHVAAVDKTSAGKTIPQADALVTDAPNLALVIRVADCGPVFVYDRVLGAAGLAHSGRKGTELNIVGRTISMLVAQYGSSPENLTVVLGPCIRPPHYEVDFAAEIARQAMDAGAQDFHDCGLNTGSDLGRFYSYRIERGNTGRHYAIMRLL